MTKLDAALLKLEGALDQTTEIRVRTLIDVPQQAIEEAQQVIEETSSVRPGASQELDEQVELMRVA